MGKGISDVVSYGDFVVTVASRYDELESDSVNVNLKIFAVRSISCFGETRASSVPKTYEENVSSCCSGHVTDLFVNFLY